MSSSEIPTSIAYLGNLLSRVNGVETFKQTKAEAMAAGISSSAATFWGLKDAVLKPIIPTLSRRDEGLTVALKVATETYLGFGIPITVAYITNNLAEAAAARIAYNFAVEVIPDALRAVRSRFNPTPNSSLTIIY